MGWFKEDEGHLPSSSKGSGSPASLAAGALEAAFKYLYDAR